jgi:CubicO group peptidase (beta-lactamase class C family)
MSPLPRCAPSAAGVEASGIVDFLDAVETDPRIEMHSLMVVRRGQVVAEGWWAPYAADRVHLFYSLSKSFTATAAAFAADEGLLDLDAPVASYFPELAEAADADPRMLVRHVACMASGHRGETWDQVMATSRAEPATDPMAAFLALPPDEAPGSIFAYNQSCTYALGAIVQRQAEQSLTSYLRPRLFDPLGIGDVGWTQTPAGRDQGFSGLHARTEDAAKLGLLYLRGGRWEGAQLISPTWVVEATRAQVPTASWAVEADESPDWTRGYGYQFWISRHGYRADGAYGQFSIVVPELDAVIATTAATDGAQPILDAVWEHLVPALSSSSESGGSESGGSESGGSESGGPTPEAEADLVARLGSLSLATVSGSGTPSSGSAWDQARFTVATDPGRTDHAVRSVRTVTLARSNDRWELTLHEDLPLPVDLGFGEWRISEPVVGDARPVLAASAAWTDDELLRAEVILLETPHRLIVECSLVDHTFTATWHTQPLSGAPVRYLHCPRGD